MRLFDRIDNLEQTNILWRNSILFDERIEIADVIPKFASEQDNAWHFHDLLSLHERERFKKFIHGAETARKGDEYFS